MSDSAPSSTDQAEKKASKVNFTNLYDQLFTPPPQPKKEQHKSFRYIPKFSSKQQQLSDLEDKLRVDVSLSVFLFHLLYNSYRRSLLFLQQSQRRF